MDDEPTRQLSLDFRARALTPRDMALIRRAMRTLERALGEPGEVLGSPQLVRNYLTLKLATLPHEVFMGIFLDTQNRVLKSDVLFRGTLTQTSVYPREVVKQALGYNAAGIILAHNHPSGVAEPSHADEALTRALRQALALVDVRVLDHFVVGGSSIVSFAERGLL